ncbi:MAG: hypothetical protein ABDI19_10900, partial [Armatimonadota bacterium]
MRQMTIWVAVLLMLDSAIAQQATNCPSCEARGGIAKILRDANKPADWVKVHDGILWVVQGRNEEDGKAIQKQLDALAKAMKDESVTLCSDCQMQRSVLRSLDWEIVKSRRGGMLIATSTDATMVT